MLRLCALFDLFQLDKLLQECNFPSVAIHASMKQEERIKMYQNFKDFKHRILVSTDVSIFYLPSPNPCLTES